jgi:hypothetical protein
MSHNFKKMWIIPSVKIMNFKILSKQCVIGDYKQSQGEARDSIFKALNNFLQESLCLASISILTIRFWSLNTF